MSHGDGNLLLGCLFRLKIRPIKKYFFLRGVRKKVLERAFPLLLVDILFPKETSCCFMHSPCFYLETLGHCHQIHWNSKVVKLSKHSCFPSWLTCLIVMDSCLIIDPATGISWAWNANPLRKWKLLSAYFSRYATAVGRWWEIVSLSKFQSRLRGGPDRISDLLSRSWLLFSSKECSKMGCVEGVVCPKRTSGRVSCAVGFPPDGLESLTIWGSERNPGFNNHIVIELPPIHQILLPTYIGKSMPSFYARFEHFFPCFLPTA